jgi:hypothetical protein
MRPLSVKPPIQFGHTVGTGKLVIPLNNGKASAQDIGCTEKNILVLIIIYSFKVPGMEGIRAST